ncbi:MAG: amino acid adenylation domain-containing protein [Acidobacteria bacterium]|nr:amino acid adenylation domain-containing protein [Acidobacteriota bacterium]
MRSRAFRIDLPGKRPAAEGQGFEVKTLHFSLGPAVLEKIRDLARQWGCTVFHVMSAAWSAFLDKHSGQGEIAFLYPVNMRPRDFAGLDGYLVNVVPMFTQIGPQTTFAGLVREIRDQRAETKHHQHVPFDRIVREYNRDAATRYGRQFGNDFNAVMVESDEILCSPLPLEGVAARNIPTQTLSNAEISLVYQKGDERLACEICFNRDRLDEVAFDRADERFTALVEALLAHPGEPVDTLGALAETERREVLGEWNGTEAPWPSDRTLQALFEAQVERTPDRPALVCADRRLSYRELNAEANRLAHTLRREYRALTGEDIRGGTLIGLYIERGVDMIVSILGILKSGAAYVPFDLADPDERLAFKVNDCNCRMVVTASASVKNLVFLALSDTWPLSVDAYRDVIAQAPATNPEPVNTPRDLAYVIYTSGSTGRPKGVMVPHEGVVNFVAYHTERMRTSREYDDVIQSISVNFDASWTEFALALFNGSCLHLVPSIARLSGEDLAGFIEHNGISVFVSTPAILANLPRRPIRGLECVISGGDVCDRATMDFWSETVALYNAYGPTEATVCTTYSRHRRGLSNRNIGKPLQNKKVYVLDRGRGPVPVGVYGELYIGGDGLARGYLHRPELTAERFVPNPFRSEAERSGGRNGTLYRTGDMVRWLPDGSLEFRERNDDQVKISGFRVELGEVESALAACPALSGCVASCREIAGRKVLVAHYTAGAPVEAETLEAYLSSRLPYYMVPSCFVQLDRLPLSVSGKVDRKSLPEPVFRSGAESYAAPSGEAETRLCGLWQELLGLERVGARDDFFRLGGDSILAIQLCSRLRSAGFTVGVKDIFDHRTVGQLARHLERGADSGIDAEQGLLEGDFELLPIQQWFFGLGFPRPEHWNQVFSVDVGPVGRSRLETALEALAARHDALRLRFGNGRQHYAREAAFPPLRELDVRDLSPGEIDAVLAGWQRGFDLADGPLWQAGYLHGYPGGGGRLFMALHHLIVDAVSWRVLAQDLRRLCEGEDPGPKTSSYRQWVEVVRDYAAAHADERGFWDAELRGARRFNARLAGSGDPVTTAVELDAEKTALLLNRAPAAYHTEVNDLLLTALARALAAFLGEPDSWVTLEGHGREAIRAGLDVSGTVGWFTTMYPVRLKAEDSLERCIRSTKEHLRALPGKGVGFGALGFLGGSGEPGGEELPRVSFNYLGQFDAAHKPWHVEAHGSGASFDPDNRLPFDLILSGAVTGGRLAFTVTARFPEERCQAFAGEFRARLEEVTLHCAAKARQGEGEFTPGDFPDVHLSGDLVERLQRSRVVEDILPAGSLQQGFVYHVLRNPADDAYRLQLLLDYRGALDPDAYRAAWAFAQQAYPSMRTCFDWEEEIVQVVCREAGFEFAVHDLRGEADPDVALEALRVRDRARGFDLGRPGLFRIQLARLGDDHHVLLKSEHHSITDGWSLRQQLRCVHQAYARLVRGETPPPVTDHAYAEAQRCIRRRRDADRLYWEDRLRDLEEATDVRPLLREGLDPDAIREVREPRECVLELSEGACSRLREACTRAGVTLGAALQFAWHKLLSLYSGEERTVAGTTVSGRELPVDGIEESVGLYINTLPVTVEWPDRTVRKQLEHVQQRTMEANAHSCVDVGRLQKGGRRLFHSLFVFENYPEARRADDAEFPLRVEVRKAVEKLDYPLALQAVESGGQLTLTLQYGAEHLAPGQAERICSQLGRILEQVPDNPDRSHLEISLLTGEEQRKTLREWNETEFDHGAGHTIVSLFEEQAERFPDHLALITDAGGMTYRELNARANRLARTLRRDHLAATGAPVAGDTLIGLYLERGADQIVAILGILKAGAAYVPFDQADPEERLRFKITDCGCRMVLTSAGCLGALVFLARSETVPLAVDAYREEIDTFPSTNPEPLAGPDNLAYVIYTSGSTGTPKGVMVEHGGVVNLARSHRGGLGITGGTRILHFAPGSFDASVSTLFCALLNGATLCVCSEETRKDPARLVAYLAEHRVSLIDIPARLLEVLPADADLPHLQCVITAGEVCEKKAMDLWCDKVRLVNAYGPTEATVCTTFSVHDRHKGNRNIGRPIGNKKVYVLDSRLNPLPVGVPGELHIGGVGLARGYLNRPETTRERFIANPFLPATAAGPGERRLYRTGDIVRWLPDGSLEFIGRNDGQVKVRGFRVELGEIESRLARHAAVASVAVRPYTHGQEKILCAWYTATEPVAAEELRRYLSGLLPEYMVPACFVCLEHLPLNPSGKLDVRALPAPDVRAGEESCTEPRDAVDAAIRETWQRVLGLERIGIDDDFFRIGGNSILAIKLTHQMEKALGRAVTVPEIFELRTIRALADAGGRRGGGEEEGEEVEL